MTLDVDEDTTYLEHMPAPHGPPSMCPLGREQPPPGKERWNAKYLCPREIRYRSKRYGKWLTVAKGYPSDGATHARDVNSRAWWVHDVLCDWGSWDDGSTCTNWQASMVLGDVLAEDGFWFRRWTWPVATFLLGGDACRKHMW